MALSKIVSSSLANGSVSIASITDNTVTSAKLTSTGVVANSYGNTTAIPVITIDAQGRITNATTSSVSGVTGLSFTPANSTVTVSTSTTNFDAAITSGNSTVQGLLKVVDSVSNTSTSTAASANSVTTAYQLAANAVSNATAYAATAYSNAVATAASDATTKAGTAYSNAVSYANTAAGTAYSNAISFANTIAYTAAGTAYSNAVATAASDATTKAGTAYSNATSYADTKAATAYSNVFNGGTFSGAVVVQANLTANSVRLNGDLQIDGNLTVLGNTVSIFVSTLSVEDNMIYLNSNSITSNPDLGFAGNYNDGSYAHAGLFRDATDGVWKFFHGYTPEPDASAFIDTANASFTLSNLQINYVIGNVTGSANSATYLGGNTATTLRSYSDTIAGTAYSNATSYADTKAGTAYSNAVSVAASDATTKAGTAYSNATTYAATIAGTAYSNAVSVAASDATTKAGTAYSNATSYAATIAGTAYSNATSYAATIAGTAYSNAVAYAASNSYVNSTFLKLTGGSLTGNVATSAYIHANGTSGATGGYFGMVKIGYGSSYGTVERTDSDLYLQYNNAYNVVVGYGGGYLTATNSSRAPIFYDSNNTGYYVDPASSLAANIYGRLEFNNTSARKVISLTIDNRGVFDGSLNGYLLLAKAYVSGLQNNSEVTGRIFLSRGNTGAGKRTETIEVFSKSAYNSENFVVNWPGGKDFTPGTLHKVTYGGVVYHAVRLGQTGGGPYEAFCFEGYTANAGLVVALDSEVSNVSSFGNSGYFVDTDGVFYGLTSVRSPIFYDSNDTGYYIDPNSTGTSLNAAGSVRGTYYVASNYGSTGYTQYKGYDNNNHFIMIRGVVGGTTTSPSYSGGHHTTLVEYAEANDSTGWFFKTSQTGNYDIVSRITRSYSQFVGSARAPLFYDSDNTGYYVDPNGVTNLGGVNDFPLRVLKTSGVNSGCVQFKNQYGDNSWGIVADFKIGSGSGGDRPSILFSQEYDSNTWSIGFGYADSGYFRINRDHGYVNGNWGTTLMTMDRSGNVTFAGNVTAYSDERIKKNIKKIENPLEIVRQLEGVTFNYIEDDREGLGVIAQQVEKVLPMLVSESHSSNGQVYKNVAYGNMVGLLIEAIKEQQRIVEALTKKIEVLESK